MRQHLINGAKGVGLTAFVTLATSWFTWHIVSNGETPASFRNPFFVALLLIIIVGFVRILMAAAIAVDLTHKFPDRASYWKNFLLLFGDPKPDGSMYGVELMFKRMTVGGIFAYGAGISVIIVLVIGFIFGSAHPKKSDRTQQLVPPVAIPAR